MKSLPDIAFPERRISGLLHRRAFARTVEILKRERATLDRGAALLLEKETLDETELGGILKDLKLIEPALAES
jgi:ATP-dependent Zn protease